MSQENLEVVKSLVAASQRGDWETALEIYDPEVELDASRIPGGRISTGRAAVQDFFRDWFGAWDRLAITPERFIDARENVVVVVLRLSGVGKGSGVEVSMPLVDVFTVRDGKVIRHIGYADPAEAFQSVELRH